MMDKLLEMVGLKALESKSRDWKRKQIELEIETAQQEVAELGAYIGRLIKEKQALENPAILGE
jgi:hypothetical protein